jgi:hypothetical protein
MIPDLTPQEISRFLGKLLVGDCGVTWDGPVNNHGYGRFEYFRNGKRRRILAHRLAYMLWTGEDPGPSVVRHECDTPPCCTADCLLPGTQFDNMRDAVKRGRANLSGLAVPHLNREAAIQERIARGEKTCSNCKVTKPMSAFSRLRTQSDGHKPWCKTCVATEARNRRRRRKDAA